MEKLPMTIVVPVSNDERIKACIDSIDAEVEIVVVLNNNPTNEVINIVRRSGRCRIVTIGAEGCNLAKVFNEGIKAASNRKIILMNSDCVFPPALIRKAYNQLDTYDVVKARIVFDFDTYPQRLVSQCRYLFHHVFQEGRKLFGPGLAFRKDIAYKIGGYFFDERMGWGEDGELSKRIHSSSLKILILPENIYHCQEGVAHDLRVAFRIGKGNGIKDRLERLSLKKAVLTDLGHLLADHHNHLSLAYKNGGLPLLIYLFLWKIIFHLGYYQGLLQEEEKHGICRHVV